MDMSSNVRYVSPENMDTLSFFEKGNLTQNLCASVFLTILEIFPCTEVRQNNMAVQYGLIVYDVLISKNSGLTGKSMNAEKRSCGSHQRCTIVVTVGKPTKKCARKPRANIQ